MTVHWLRKEGDRRTACGIDLDAWHYKVPNRSTNYHSVSCARCMRSIDKVLEQ